VLLDSVRFLLAGNAVGGENQVTPRTIRASAGGYCYHALNRGNERSRVFHDADDDPGSPRVLKKRSRPAACFPEKEP